MSKKKTLSASDFGLAAAETKERTGVGLRPPNRYFLIVCEGEKTEPNYFEAIKRELPKEMVKRITITGTGRSTLSLLRAAEEEIERRYLAGLPPYYYVWLVFDRDSFEPDDFDNAIATIQSKPHLKQHWFAAWSNEAFELWYLLHFQEATGGPMGREQYQTMLQEYLGGVYRKNAVDMYERLKPLTPTAIRRARRGLRLQAQLHLPYHQMNPATTVQELVAELLRYRR